MGSLSDFTSPSSSDENSRASTSQARKTSINLNHSQRRSLTTHAVDHHNSGKQIFKHHNFASAPYGVLLVGNLQDHPMSQAMQISDCYLQSHELFLFVFLLYSYGPKYHL